MRTTIFCLFVLLGIHASRGAEDSYSVLRSGDMARVEKLLGSGVSPNERDSNGNTLLMHAAVCDGPDMLRLLLDKGADVNATNHAGATALMRAAGNHEKIRLLVERGANVNARSALGNTPLILAARAYGSSESVELLLRKGARVAATNVFGANAIMAAAASGDLETTRLLLKHGADVNSHSRGSEDATVFGGGRSPLMWAAFRGDLPLARLLLAAGANVNSREGFGSALTHAAWADRFEMARLLLERGANPNQREFLSGFTALHWAASSERPETALVELLLKHGANPNAEGGDPVDAYLGIPQTPLMLARRRGETDIVRALLAAGGKENPFPQKASDGALRELPDGATSKSIRAALERSVPKLQDTSLASREAFLRHASKQDCVSCHQQYIPLATLAFTEKSGVACDAAQEEKLLAMARRDAAISVDLTVEAAFHPEPVHSYGYALFALSAKKEKPSPEIDAMIHHLLVIQGKDGNWFNNLPRPPIQTSDVGATALAVHGLAEYGFPGRSKEIKERVERARGWLAKVEPANTEERISQLLGLAWAGENPSQLRKLADNLLKEQREDGGWAQLPKLRSDAYATGYTLYALHVAGVGRDDRQIQRGFEYLLKTQREDGSWFVARRAFPFQPTMTSGFPNGKDSWISASATGWATIALSLALEKTGRQARIESRR